jgi:branched-chain amino acid aminotransferase
LIQEKVPKEDLLFGKVFSDHMFEMDWNSKTGWKNQSIHPYRNISLSPAASVFHYGLECFEGMKAYKDSNGSIRLFRPDKNFERMNNSLIRLAMPTFDPNVMLFYLSQLLRVDADWIPEGEGYSLYIRPTAISTEPFLGVAVPHNVKIFIITSPVGPYYPEGFNPISLYADTKNVRAWPGGVGSSKVGGNYAPTIKPMQDAISRGCSQVLWLFGPEHNATEVGSMNLFFYFINEQGEKELATAPLSSGDILPGVTRDSILTLARGWNEFKVSERFVTLPEIVQAQKDGRLLEIFGAGTAAVIAPVKKIVYNEYDIVVPTGSAIGPLSQRFWETLIDIQYGRVTHPWSITL